MDDYQRSICYLEPYQGESISHYLGRWMNQEVVSISSSSSLSQQLRLGKTLWRWERFYFNPPPSEDELEILGEILELSQVQLRELFPPVEEPINPHFSQNLRSPTTKALEELGLTSANVDLPN